ncbi:hypothetical protein HDF13_003475 [Edaphobacter lichenicola]|uniref:Uncharacterized protein n=1 Tax=Tunturiibacter gelidiferens TaxID=3069689 RepID=A0ACC5P2R6_9BACT|nr:hypothetical protein [Edaphobacter lichenicola]
MIKEKAYLKPGKLDLRSDCRPENPIRYRAIKVLATLLSPQPFTLATNDAGLLSDRVQANFLASLIDRLVTDRRGQRLFKLDCNLLLTVL